MTNRYRNKPSQARRELRLQDSEATHDAAGGCPPPEARDGLTPAEVQNLYAAQPHLRGQDDAWASLLPRATHKPAFDPDRELEAGWYAGLVCAHTWPKLLRKLQRHRGVSGGWDHVREYGGALRAFRDRLRHLQDDSLGPAGAVREFNARFRDQARRVLRQCELLVRFDQDIAIPRFIPIFLVGGNQMAAEFGPRLEALQQEAVDLAEQMGCERDGVADQAGQEDVAEQQCLEGRQQGTREVYVDKVPPTPKRDREDLFAELDPFRRTTTAC